MNCFNLFVIAFDNIFKSTVRSDTGHQFFKKQSPFFGISVKIALLQLRRKIPWSKHSKIKLHTNPVPSNSKTIFKTPLSGHLSHETFFRFSSKTAFEISEKSRELFKSFLSCSRT